MSMAAVQVFVSWALIIAAFLTGGDTFDVSVFDVLF